MMDKNEEKPEIGRFQNKGESNEPIEPFLPDEMIQEDFSKAPEISHLHVPKSPIQPNTLRGFLIELNPLVEDFFSLKKKDQFALSEMLKGLKKDVDTSELDQAVKEEFDRMLNDFYNLVTESRVKHQETVLEAIAKLQQLT